MLQCDVPSTNPGVSKFRKSAIVCGSSEGVASEKQTTCRSKRVKCPDANPNLSALDRIAFVAVLHRSSHNFSSIHFGFHVWIFSVSCCDELNAAQHLVSNVLHPNNPTLSDLQTSEMTSSQSWKTASSGAVAARMFSTLLSIWSSSSELCRNPMLSPSKTKRNKNNRARSVSMQCHENRLLQR